MHQLKLKRISLAVFFAFVPFLANAAGLGKLSVMSGLGEPLNAEIELLSTDTDDLATLTAAIASEDAYASQGVERTGLHSLIKVEVSKRNNGTPVLKLTTNQPVSEPFVDMLIQVDWATGRLVREYTALLDPPGYSQPPAQQAVATTQKKSVGSANKPDKQTNSNNVDDQISTDVSGLKVSSDSRSVRKKTSKNQKVNDDLLNASKSESSDSYLTQSGDTLHSIAKNLQVDGVSLDQMLIGIYQSNKSAFDGNMNRLKVGQILKVPSKENLLDRTQKSASAEIRAQSVDWNAYKNKLAGMVADSKSVETKVGQSEVGKISTKAEDKAMPDSSGPKDVVRLSKNNVDKKVQLENSKAVQDKLNALQEEAIARENSVKEANERTAALEKQIADMQKLLAIKSQAMADLQKNATEKIQSPKAEAVKSATDPAVNQPVATKSDSTNVAQSELRTIEQSKTVNQSEANALRPEDVKPVPEKQHPEKNVAETNKINEKVINTLPLNTETESDAASSESSLVDTILNNPMTLGGIVLLLLAGLAAVWIYLRNKQKKNLDGFEQSILTSGGLKANTVFGNTAGGSIDTGSAFLTDFSQSGSGMIDTNDVDPIAEAEVYMAYGRDSQAEEILKDAIIKEPKRYELHLKLLEILASRQDASGYETVAGELYTTLGADDPVWIKVAEIGRGVEPNNPLYQISDNITPKKQSVTTTINDNNKNQLDKSLDTSLDFSIDDAEASQISFEEVLNDENSLLDFDLTSNENKPEETATFDQPLDPINLNAENKPNSLDFQLDIGIENEPGTEDFIESQSISDKEAPIVSGISDISLDFDSTLPGISNSKEMSDEDADSAIEVSNEQLGSSDQNSISIDLELPNFGENISDINITNDIQLDTPVEQKQNDFDKTVMLKGSELRESLNFADMDIDLGEPSSTSLDIDFGNEEEAPLDVGTFMSDLIPEISSSILPDMTKKIEQTLPDLNLASINLDLDSTPIEDVEATTDILAESPEVETKLDLVNAYIDMGDSEGARELLEEVLKEGGSSQKIRAQALLSNLN